MGELNKMPERAAMHTGKDPQTSKHVFISAEETPALALLDLWQGLKHQELWWPFAVHDIKQRFRRSTLGPFWLTLSMGIMVAALGFVFSKLFNQEISIFYTLSCNRSNFLDYLNAIFTIPK